MDFETSNQKVEALTHPRNAVVVGASDRPGSWASRVWRNLHEYNFPGKIYPFNPGRSELYGQPCYGDFKSLPEPPDHLVVLVPAPHVPELLRQGAAAGARSATVFSSGFGEAYDKGAEKLGEELRKAIADTGIGVSGPNCMGNICGPASFVTLTEERPLAPGFGPVALVGQSGGIMIFMNAALDERGIKAGYLITSGNEAGLGIADYIAYFATQPEVKVIFMYSEGLKDVARFRAACRLARANGKEIVAYKLGHSEAGRGAAMAHTGSLAGTLEAFDAVAGDLGVVRAETLDDAVEICELLVHTGAPQGRRLGAITLSGAYRGMLYDAADRNGLVFPTLEQTTLDGLNSILGVGSLVSNPVDGGFGVLTSEQNFLRSVEALDADANVDMILLQDSLPRVKTAGRGERYIRLMEDYVKGKATKPIAFITPTSHGQSDYSRGIRAEVPHISFLQEANKALRAIAKIVRSREREALGQQAAKETRQLSDAQKAAVASLKSRVKNTDQPLALNEHESKHLLRLWGVPVGEETLVQTAQEAIEAAQKIGYPVVLKAVAATLLHKSDVGAVQLNLNDATAVKSAFSRIEENLRAHAFSGKLEGMLVARQAKGGLEIVLGIHRDPEVGPVVMAGAGGVLLELTKDVAFASAPISREKALDLLAQTNVGTLLKGYRGGPKYDIEAAIQAIMALGRVAEDMSSFIHSADVNPFVIMAVGQGAVALDALMIVE
jgi:acyl-CoA synthetase (NDP forming)